MRMRIIIAIAIAIAMGAFVLLIIDNNKTSIQKQKRGDLSLIEYGTTNIQQKPTQHVDDDNAAGSNEDDGEKPQLNSSAEVEFETSSTSDVYIYYII